MEAATALTSASQVTLRYGGEPDKGWGDASSVVTPYVSFPQEFIAPYAENEITSVRIAVMEEGTNCYLYIKNKPDDQKYIYRQKLESLQPGWNEITLDTPFTISGQEPIAIGYKASFAKAGVVGISNEKFPNADHVYYNNQNKWTSTGGSICIMATVEGDNMPVNEMMISTLKEFENEDSDLHAYTGSVRNVGNNTVETYTITISLDGEEAESITGSPLDVNEEESFIFTIGSNTGGSHTVTAEITSVNNTEDSYAPNNSASVIFNVQEEQFTRRIVCEEYTGTWCGWCPRGMVGLELMKEDYPDTFIPIAIHSYDDLEIEDLDTSYKSFIEDGVDGAPSCNVNRRLSGDPYYDIRKLYDLEMQNRVHISVEATCDWNADNTALELVTTYYSDIDLDNPELNIAYTITESGIIGYPQTNYYSDGRNGEFYGWDEKTDPTLDVTYNDVARALIGGYGGMPCRNEPMTAFEEYTHKQTIQLPDNIISPNNIKVIPQIIDGTSGHILNAVAVTPEAAGVHAADASSSQVSIKAENGRLSITAEGGNNFQVLVYTTTGQLITSKNFKNAINIPVPSGIYVTIVRNEKNILTHTKVIL